MKNRLMISFKLKITAVLFSVVIFACVSAINSYGKKTAEPVSNQRIDELDEMDFVEMLNSVDVGSASSLIQKFQNKEARSRLIKGKYDAKKDNKVTVESFRNKEVLLITIPASYLFDPNMTTLKEGAADYLSPIERYLKDPDMYRVLLVMHTDNTGSEVYRENITFDRVNSVFDWYENRGLDTTYLFSYYLSDEMPLKPNNTMENRDKNRRLEIYLVPGKKMVEQAQKGKITF